VSPSPIHEQRLLGDFFNAIRAIFREAGVAPRHRITLVGCCPRCIILRQRDDNVGECGGSGAGLSRIDSYAGRNTDPDAHAVRPQLDQAHRRESGPRRRFSPRRPRGGMTLASKVLVMTGGPGVGKTTIIRAILRILAAKGVKLVCTDRPRRQADDRGHRLRGQNHSPAFGSRSQPPS